MTDRDLIIAAAEKVMGFEVITAKQYHRMRGVPSAETFVEDDKGLWRRNPRENDHFTLPWNPLESITDAWMLVEKLAEGSVLVSVRNLFDGDSLKWWVCTATAYTQPQGYIAGQWQEDADTGPRAIVLAALRAAGVGA